MRSVAQEWRKGSVVAVDAGVHLSAITRLIEAASPPPPRSAPFQIETGPFAGLSLPHTSATANAAHITSSLVDTYLITHPHLDHISGFVINTAGLPGTRPKKLAGLPSTIHAFKTHIFNNVIWPNLSDENNGAGLLTYLRLVEGGSPALGDGEGRGYSEVCDGLLVKTWGVSHGHCIEKHSHRGSASSASARFDSHDSPSQLSRRDQWAHQSAQNTPRRQSLLNQTTFGSAASGAGSPQGVDYQERICVYDSSAYFIQEQASRREVLMFGDVEPDSISLSPRNSLIWQEAAPKIAAGTLAAIFIECSYDDSQSNDRLFGHLKPVFIMEEMAALAQEVESVRKSGNVDTKKRKRSSLTQENGRHNPPPPTPDEPVSPRTVNESTAGDLLHSSISPGEPEDTPHLATPTSGLSLADAADSSPVLTGGSRPLGGLKVVIIHVKERLTDGPDVGETILEQLEQYELEAQLGCEFIISQSGQSFYL